MRKLAFLWGVCGGAVASYLLYNYAVPRVMAVIYRESLLPALKVEIATMQAQAQAFRPGGISVDFAA